MPDLQFAIIGAGFWAPYQLAAWQEIVGAKCVAVCDIVRSQAESLARKHGIDRIYDNAEALFAEESLDFVDVITSPKAHQPLVHLASKHGVPTICQKPLAESLEAGLAMISTCKKAGIPLLVHENFRWQRPLRELRKVLDSNRIGKVFRARLHYGSSFPVFENQPFLRDLERFMLADVGVHLMEVASFLFGEAKSLYYRHWPTRDFEALCAAGRWGADPRSVLRVWKPVRPLGARYGPLPTGSASDDEPASGDIDGRSGPPLPFGSANRHLFPRPLQSTSASDIGAYAE